MWKNTSHIYEVVKYLGLTRDQMCQQERCNAIHLLPHKGTVAMNTELFKLQFLYN